jgi:hypothetical protein
MYGGDIASLFSGTSIPPTGTLGSGQISVEVGGGINGIGCVCFNFRYNISLFHSSLLLILIFSILPQTSVSKHHVKK